MTQYRYQLERYRGRSTRHVCPQCGRKNVFTRYIDTENNNIYISDNVGKCNRLDKCGYHYTPHQYFTDNPWKRDTLPREDGSLRPCGYHYTPHQYFTDNPWKRESYYTDNVKKRGDVCLFVQKHRYFEQTNKQQGKPSPPKPRGYIPEWVLQSSRRVEVLADHVRWLATTYGTEQTQRIFDLYEVGMTHDKRVIFWQIDYEGRIRTGKVMAYDPITGKRRKEPGSITWVHSDLKRAGILSDDWHLEQCLYGEHLLQGYPTSVVAVTEAYKTAHVGAILYPDMVWVAVDSMMGLTAERLAPLKGRDVILFPDEGKGYEVWSSRIADIAQEVGFRYRVSSFMEGREQGSDIADLAE